MFKNLNFQEFLSLAYVILVIVGIISESIFYGVLGIQYIQHTSILDALLSPFTLITSDLRIFLIVTVIIFCFYLYIAKLLPWIFKKLNKPKPMEEVKSKKVLYPAMIFATLILFPSMRIGMAISYSEKLESNSFKNDIIICFKNDEKIKVKKIGQNSSYIFYVQEGEKVVTVTPISDNIKQIKSIPKHD